MRNQKALLWNEKQFSSDVWLFYSGLIQFSLVLIKDSFYTVDFVWWIQQLQGRQSHCLAGDHGSVKAFIAAGGSQELLGVGREAGTNGEV